MSVSFLDRERTIAVPGYSRWLIPPAALCVHLCIGQAYAFSVFNLPIFFLGASAAVFGRWVEEGGPRRAMFMAALCWGGGFLLSAIGVYLHQLWIIYAGYGVIGGT